MVRQARLSKSVRPSQIRGWHDWTNLFVISFFIITIYSTFSPFNTNFVTRNHNSTANAKKLIEIVKAMIREVSFSEALSICPIIQIFGNRAKS